MTVRNRRNNGKPEEDNSIKIQDEASCRLVGNQNRGSRDCSFDLAQQPWFYRFSNLAYAAFFLILGISTPSMKRIWEKHQSKQVETRQLPVPPKRLLDPHPCSPKGGLLPEFWHDLPEPGLHLVCLRGNEADFYRRALESNRITVQFTPGELETLFEHHLELPSKGPHKWSVYTHHGEKVFDQDSFDGERLQRDYQFVLVFEGGVWRWPGVRVGFRRNVKLSDGRSLILETLALSPLVLASHDFLTSFECQEIREAAAPTLTYSDVVLMDKDAGRPATDFRTSSSAFLTRPTPLMRTLNDRTADFLKIPRTHQEHLQVLRYQVGEKYDIHDDFFDPAKYQNDPGTLQATENGHRNRMATFFWYLSNVTGGGETSFPKVNGRRPSSMLDCTHESLLVKPEMGKVVLFYSMKADGKLDFRSTHAACPVLEGIKWAANKWVWNKPMRYIP